MSLNPNIIMIVSDHQAYYRHGWDGGVRPQTPHFNRLASEGIRFDRSYCASPLCGPSRRTLLTGLYAHNHKNYYNYSNSPYDHEVYLDTLAGIGYKNFYYGKWHAGSGTAKDFNCEGLSYTDYGNPYMSKEYREYLELHDLPPAEHYVERMFWNPTMKVQFPKLQQGAKYRCDGYWCGEHAVGLTLTPKETHESFFLANLACDKLEELAKSGDDQPFHLRVDFWGPHQPHFPTQEFADLYDPKDIQEYGSFRDTLKKKPDFFLKDPNRPLSNENNDFIVPSPLPWHEWQKIIARAFAHITMVDAAAGTILDKLDELGLTDNTIVIWTADHGDALASHGGRFDKGSYMTEEVIRVPLAIRYPGAIEPGLICHEFVSGVDIVPTILNAAGTGFSNRVDGSSLLPLATGKNTNWREDLLAETYGHGFGRRDIGRLVLWKNYKYIDYKDQIKELYNLEEDPYELNNLIDDPAYQDVIKEMKVRLIAWQDQTNDTDFYLPVSQAFIQADLDALHDLSVRRGLVD